MSECLLGWRGIVMLVIEILSHTTFSPYIINALSWKIDMLPIYAHLPKPFVYEPLLLVLSNMLFLFELWGGHLVGDRH